MTRSIAQNSPGSSDAGRTLLLGNPLLGNVTPADPDDSIADANAPSVSGSTEASLSGAPDDFRRRVGTYLDVLQILANSYDGRRFSVAGQAELLSRDSDRIIEFVTRKIAFEPYAGSLRGPLGTLLTRSGNALDQSRLLAELLSELGLEVRIGATSADPELNELLRSLYFDQQRQVPNESLGAGVAESVATALNISTEQVLKGIADAQAAQVLQAGALVERADRWSAELAAILGDKIDAASNLPLEFDEIHYRVDYRSGAGEWRSVDPTGAGHSEISVGDTLYAADELPASAFHTFAIDLKLRVEKPDGELQDIGLLTWQAPSAKLFDRTIQVSVFPSDFEAIVTADDFDAAFSETDDYTATISLDNGDLDIARFFDLNGEVFDTPPNPEIAQAEDQAAAITGGLGGIGGALGGIFGGDPTAEPATTPEETGTIIGLWATYTLSSPTKNLERTRIVLPAVEVVDWQDGQATTRSSDWTKTELQKQLIWNTQLHVMTGPTAPDFVSHRILSSILAGRAAIEASLDAVVGAENTAQALGASLNAFTEGVSSGTSFEAMILAASGQELSRQQIETSNASSRIYSPTAGLVAFERRASVPDELTKYLTLTETYDVIEMPGIVITAAGSEPKENFRNGVIWTAVEQALSEQKQSTLGTPDEAAAGFGPDNARQQAPNHRRLADQKRPIEVDGAFRQSRTTIINARAKDKTGVRICTPPHGRRELRHLGSDNAVTTSQIPCERCLRSRTDRLELFQLCRPVARRVKKYHVCAGVRPSGVEGLTGVAEARQGGFVGSPKGRLLLL